MNVNAAIEEIFGVKAEVFADGVAKVSFPRTDLKVTIDNKLMEPFMGLTSWVSFQKGVRKEVEVMIMGDLCLFEDEVNSAMSIALENSIEVTALHNHFFFDDPKVYFMHIGGEGNFNTIALGIRKILDTVQGIRRGNPHPQTHFKGPSISNDNSIDGKPIEEILGVAGQAKEGMFKVVIGRQARAGCGCIVGKNMGVYTWAAFGGSNEDAVVCGDVALLEDELQPVLKTLRAGNINVVAIHNHMTFEQPRFIFIHYWGKDRAVNLTRALKSVLEKTQFNLSKNDDSKCEECDHEA